MHPFRLAAAAATAVTLAGPASACGSVSITEMDWASSAIVTAVSTFLMEQGYGCTVTTVPSSTTPALVSVAETGTPDIVTEIWPTGLPAYDRLLEAGKITPVADVLSDGGAQGWYIPAYLAEARPELTTLEGLKANAALFEGRLNTCPDGWSCRYATDNLFEVFEMAEAGFKLFAHGSGETLAASIAAAHADEAPWLGYYWSPTAVIGRYPMVKVDLGPVDPDAFDCAVDTDCTTTTPTGFPSSPVKTVLTTAFAEREPAIAELMSQVSFTNAQMSAVLAWQEENGASNEEAAVHFLTDRPDVWGAWLNEDARDRLSALLEN